MLVGLDAFGVDAARANKTLCFIDNSIV